MEDSGDKSQGQELLRELDLDECHRVWNEKPEVRYTRDLTVADLEAPRVPKAPSLVRIHSSHHSVARCLATGMRPGQVSLVTGYSTSRVNALEKDPAFQALVQDYKNEAKSVFADLAERMNDISLDAIELLHERLQEKPTEFSIPMLLDVIKAFADRTGHGPNQEVSLRVSADMIDRPPRETFEDWQNRRKSELGLDPPKRLN